MRQRKDLTNKMVNNALKANKGNIHRTAIELGCSRSVVHKVKSGERRDPPQIKKHTDGLCSCCGHRPVWKQGGLEKLCQLCFKYRDRGVSAAVLHYRGYQ